MIPQYAQMRRVRYEAPQWLVEPGEAESDSGVQDINGMIVLCGLEEVWSEEVKGYAPYTHIVRLFDYLEMSHYLVVRA